MAVVMPMEDFPYLPSGVAEVNKMIKEHSNLFSDSQCKVCSAVLISESQKLTHYQSKKHANKVRRYMCIQNEIDQPFKKVKTSSAETDCNNGDTTERDKVCTVCNMIFSAPVVAESHYQGKVHSKNLRLKKSPAAPQPAPVAPPKKKVAAVAVAADEPSDATAAGNGDPDRFCSICQASFNNPLMAQQHYVGKKHRKQMTKLKLMKTYGPSTAPASTVKGYPCTVCSIELNSVEQYQAHISGAKHKNQMKKSGSGPAENQYALEQHYGEDKEFSVGDNQFAVGDNQFAVGDNQFAVGDNQFAVGDNQFAVGDNQFSVGDKQFSGGNNQCSEEYQYT